MVLVARWRNRRKRGPKLIAVTIDHGLRREAKKEADAVKKLARSLGIGHRTLRWRGRKPKTGLQEAARNARYRLLADVARKAGRAPILTAHTRDDQAETVLFRMMRGSGIAGLAGMRHGNLLPGYETDGIELFRPLLDIPKSRLIATLKAAKISYADDPSNRDPRFTRARLRELMPLLAAEGLTAERLARLGAPGAAGRDCTLRGSAGGVAQARASAMAGPWAGLVRRRRVLRSDGRNPRPGSGTCGRLDWRPGSGRTRQARGAVRGAGGCDRNILGRRRTLGPLPPHAGRCAGDAGEGTGPGRARPAAQAGASATRLETALTNRQAQVLGFVRRRRNRLEYTGFASPRRDRSLGSWPPRTYIG